MANDWGILELVGGAITILKNDDKCEFVNGKDDIPYMKWKIKAMFPTTNQGIIGKWLANDWGNYWKKNRIWKNEHVLFTYGPSQTNSIAKTLRRWKIQIQTLRALRIMTGYGKIAVRLRVDLGNLGSQLKNRWKGLGLPNSREPLKLRLCHLMKSNGFPQMGYFIIPNSQVVFLGYS